MAEQENTNREYKDRLFKFIFGNPENKAWTLSLYNAINGSNYTDPEAVRLTTIEDAVYMGMKNDASFLISDIMNLFEQQASFNPNMPMRFLIYAGMLYSKYIKTNPDYREYSSSQQKAPTPRCICFYNGVAKMEDIRILSLSDAFGPVTAPDIEVKVSMININYGRNRELMEACKPLKEYSWFVDKIRNNQEKSYDLEAAIDEAVKEMPEDFLIKHFIIENQAEVKNMCITEYDEQRAFAGQRAEGYEEGIAEGVILGKAQGFEVLASLVRDGLLSLPIAAERIGMSQSEFKSKAGLTT